MGIRKGFLLGFLVGSAAGSVLAQERTAEAPESENPDSGARFSSLLGLIRDRIRTAMVAAQEAKAEKESELSRRFEEMKGQKE